MKGVILLAFLGKSTEEQKLLTLGPHQMFWRRNEIAKEGLFHQANSPTYCFHVDQDQRTSPELIPIKQHNRCDICRLVGDGR